METVEIVDPDDHRLNDYTQLTDVQLRLVREPAEGLFLAEGEKVIRRALAAGFVPRSALMQTKWLPGLKQDLDHHNIEVYLAEEAVLRQVTGFRLHRGALAAFVRPATPSVAHVLEGARTVVVMEDLVDHTNVGLVFRSAAALGADAILVSPQCADPLYRRSVKVSMGAVFTVPWTRAQPWPWVLDDLAEIGFARLALTPGDSAVSLLELDLPTDTRRALLLGSEGPGLSRDALARVDTHIRIPMHNGIDSLNVAAAAAVACFVLAT